jgi:hypothetical protein
MKMEKGWRDSEVHGGNGPSFFSWGGPKEASIKGGHERNDEIGKKRRNRWAEDRMRIRVNVLVWACS